MHLGSILDMTLPDNTFDVVFCAHVLYHINGADQERAVRQLIRVTKPGGRVVFLYFNPGSPFRVAGGLVSRLLSLAEKLRALAEKLGAKSKNQAEAAPELYFLAHRLSWWQRFSDTCRLSIQPWEVVGSRVERLLIWSDGMARMFYAASAAFETRLPALAAQAWMFPIIILDKQ
jgi:SAM-dependent methyltransferase